MATVFPQSKAQGRVDNKDRHIPIDVYHDKIHTGDMFSVFGEITLNDTEVHVLHVKTGTKEVHIYGTIASSGTGTVKIYADSTLSGVGTPITIQNRNQRFQGVTTPEATVYHTPTESVEGTQIDSYLLGADKKAGGEGRNDHEWIFAPNKSYQIKIASGANSNDIVARVLFYEVEV